MAEDSFHGLPPMNRFKLLHKKASNSATPPDPSSLPAKKRIVSRREGVSTVTTFCLPAKKRIWAPHSFFSPLDLSDEEIPLQPPEKKLPPPPEVPIEGLGEVEARYAEDPCEKKEEKASVEDEGEEDGVICSVCNSTDGDPSDPIVFCDGCDLTVHATCYGDPLVRAIPEGDWFCCRCNVGKNLQNVDTNCCLCPIKGGATKPTVDGRWAHISCVFLVPELFFQDAEGREGIDCSRVPRRRWEGFCYVCSSTNGCVIECSEPKCSLAFHVGCGLEEELCIEYREGKGGAVVAGFCKTHTELWYKQQQTGKFKIVPREHSKGSTKKT